MSKDISILGAGLVGSLLSIYLSRRGHRVNIYERRPDMRKTNIAAGRSINLALSDRGWRGLEGVGIADEIKKIAIPMYGRFIHLKTGEPGYQPYGKDNQAIYAVSRAEINMKLMDLAEQQPGVKIYFNEKCAKIERQHLQASFENIETGKMTEASQDLLFGAD